MELRQLRYFSVVARMGSFSRAAAELYMTQPPLSAAIAQLESDLGSRLLTRTSRGVTLTATGAEVLRLAERALAQERELRRRIAAIESGRSGTLEISCTPTLSGAFLPKMLRELTSDSADLDVSVHEADPLTVIEAVIAQKTDAGLVATSSTEDIRTLYHESIAVDFITMLEMIAVLPPSYERGDDPIPLSDIAHLDFAVPGRSMRDGIRVGLLYAFERAGLPLPRIRDVPSMQEAIPLITAGLYVAIMPESVRSLIHPDRVVLRRIADGPRPLEASAVYRADRRELPTIRRFRDAALAVAGEPDEGGVRRS
ncbi:LysR family transcriptional regulator [Phytoactinopolyspora endophytica]|uniref:LysR family transcriptional regulator n=1 Tax=Phytoactinopolyspora endophytica TaxID=1642495 RepID=UPI00101BF8A7|nr:LysR family transcriptional regulator [Phytoactinopolyspora endophytica]